jgi:ubiquinone/menaquinone biosynthesis C-methylase UbiE
MFLPISLASRAAIPRSRASRRPNPSAAVQPSRHEDRVERLYERGVARYGDYGNGYLNFGLWTPGVTDYVTAAEAMVLHLGRMLELSAAARLLDAAPGMGAQDVLLDRSFGPLEIDAVDVTAAHVAQARRRAREAGAEHRLRFHHGSATRLPFDDQTFSHALCLEAAHHFDTRGQFFTEAARVLKPGGLLVLADFVLTHPPRTAWHRLVLEATCSLWQVPRANVATIDQYEAALSSAGFRMSDAQVVSDRTFPGYYREQCRPERRREVTRIRGFIGGRIGHILNVAIHGVHVARLVDYVLVRAERR